MAYIGQEPVNTFSPLPTKDTFTGDGSTTTFDLGSAVVSGGENALEVFINNVRQEPGSGKAFTLGQDGSGDLKRITFSAAPASGASIYVINDKTSSTSVITPSDLNGAEFILDADADTSITADTDDRIDFKLANTDHIQLGTSSGDTTIKIATDAKDLQFLQADGYKVLEINDGGFVGVGGNSNAAGEIRIFEDTDNGSNYVGFSAPNVTTSRTYIFPAADGTSGTSLTTDGSGNLSWSASLTIANDGNNRVTTATGSSGLNGEANLQFDGSTLAVTGATTISTDLTVGDDLSLDSDAAVLNFGDDQDVSLTHVADTGLLLNAAMVIQFRDSGLTIGSNADGDLDIVSDGTAVDSINIESAGGITLDAGTAGNGIIYEDDGTEMMRIHNSSSDVILESKVSDKDIIFKVNDGGSSTEVARFDGDVSALLMASGKEIRFADSGEKISGNGTDLTLNSGADINLTATTDINVPANVGITFGDDAEKIEGDGTDLTISGNNINLTATADVNIPSGVGLTFATAEKIESDGTDLTVTVGSGGDINVGANIGVTFGDDGEKIEGDGTDLTIASSAKINLTATSDVHIPNNVGIVFGGDSEKIEGDGTDLTISANNLTIDAAADINLDADGADVNIKDGGTTILSFTNSSSDAVITAGVQDKDIIFKGDDNGSAITALTLDMSASGDATFNSNIAIADNGQIGSASDSDSMTISSSGVVTFSQAPVFPDGSIAVADLDIDGATDIGADIVDADLFIIDDGAGGTNRKTTASRIKTYIGGGTQWQAIKTANYTAVAGQGVFANTTSSAFTVTLPASPSLGDEVTIVDYAGTFDSNALTVGRNSQPIQGVAEDLVVSTERASFTLVYVDSTQGWLFKND
jgi:hypothetical protein